mmetsp:Transcript_51538/g.85394  ORF Transcript_51538/g.85394 Transcript_51538/m.85394 type:complete len:83 (+) Transcript_51538:110-358(+)|eukprot:CAMPEP_0202685578 /NCGR_PEP_ID=MMETSP1385-20130828/1380_1 /ASSEMBLY_ACC=CAM_ASM_000861 /TAXON_ID=933848 /ORGANISM="Elphidium margaritaceum" /LENGTH=82 /DNA_ID=CAMNT_0049339969 /DNA_START=102 /DNA_END=350 /DNA_ORIENTATION=+
MAKGKTKHHTAKELARKAAIAKKAKEPKGQAGVKNRKEIQIKKAFCCYICQAHVPDEKNMNIHWEAKHAKKGKIDLEKCTMK